MLFLLFQVSTKDYHYFDMDCNDRAAFAFIIGKSPAVLVANGVTSTDKGFIITLETTNAYLKPVILAGTSSGFVLKVNEKCLSYLILIYT